VLFGALWLSWGYALHDDTVPEIPEPPTQEESLRSKPSCQADYVAKYGQIFLPQPQEALQSANGQLGASNGFASDTSSSSFELACVLGGTGRCLRSTRITGLPRYYTSVRPSAPHRYSPPRGSSTCGFSLGIGATSSHVPHKRLDRVLAAFMPDAIRAVNRCPPD